MLKKSTIHISLRSLLALLLILALSFSAVSCRKGGSQKKKEKAAVESTTGSKEDTQQVDEIMVEQLVDKAMKKLTLEQKIGQLFIVCTDSLDFDAETELTEAGAKQIEKYQPGGVIFFSFNLKDREQTSKFIQDMQSHASTPMFMAVDEEGGRVSRIANTEGMGTTRFPSMSEIGKTGDPMEAWEAGGTIGREIKELGFNLDFAPVADITTNETNTEIGDRSFGSDPQLVADMVSSEVEGLQEEDVCATLKHFPGQGDCSEDTHKGYVNLETSIDRLREVEFLPFEAGIKAGADFVMVSHVAVSSITQNEVPASLSPLMVTDILRGELQHNGVIITDAMNMKVITKFYDPAQAAVMALSAGNDIVLMPDNFEEAYNGVLEAVHDGDLSEKTINAAAERILNVKIRRGIIPLESELLK